MSTPIPTLWVHPKDCFGSEDDEPGFEDRDAEAREARAGARRVSAELAVRAQTRGLHAPDGSALSFAVVAGLVDWHAHCAEDGGWYGWPSNAAQRYRCFVVEVVNVMDGQVLGDPQAGRAAGQVAQLALLRRMPVLARICAREGGPGLLARVVAVEAPAEEWGTWTLKLVETP